MDWNMFGGALSWTTLIVCGVIWLSLLASYAASEFDEARRTHKIVAIVAVPVAMLNIALIAGMGWYSS